MLEEISDEGEIALGSCFVVLLVVTRLHNLFGIGDPVDARSWGGIRGPAGRITFCTFVEFVTPVKEVFSWPSVGA